MALLKKLIFAYKMNSEERFAWEKRGMNEYCARPFENCQHRQILILLKNLPIDTTVKTNQRRITGNILASNTLKR